MKRFEVGRTYGAFDTEVTPITVERRTEKSLFFRRDGRLFRQKIHTDEEGYEYTYDSSFPASWRQAYTHSAMFEK